MSQKETRHFIVVFLADFDETLKMATANTLSELFQKEIEEDFLHVIEAFPQYYPKLLKLKVKFGDSQNRTKWRSKQNIDFAFLMCYCQDLSHHYLHVEDDVIASPSFFWKAE
ncbi:Alpha-1,3-mannosyl-glycoprotein 4-beta-N-acetylglucosaminyltransferase C [Desmophyllum pertusum]|uniref:Alpha-1,3-mannosyl-glycoprotein 4-beta-N-acetylglucosaminyltransferase C n=1 Tax=Desmophyllum pertusum TaxID=174260 RepID=A0A9W9Z9W8_9CNID|nr:Alpha-1,3-mannosyl-glycoprotein 4-beta-N-acetylglucosaminyltransferase C [Desmophyllum pertusum]